ncbi:MAG: sensor histidine kinase [Sporolactobacillus sp.]|jgi:signal transduction histidine kinase|nr:sensor histidine kinase [Sporolactobacillus sp.]
MMNPSDYMRDRAAFFWSLLALLLLFLGVFAVFHISFWVYTLVLALGGSAVAASLHLDYRRRKQFFDRLSRQFERLDQKYLLAELAEPPSFAEGAALHDLLKATDKAMIEEINRYKFAMKDYREYIELWVHEVKTPIASSRLILDNHPSEIAASLREELEKVENLLEQVLFYARSSDVEKDYVIRRCNLKQIVDETLQRHRRAFINAHVRLACIDLDQRIAVDPKWLMFILGQLLANAIKYRRRDHPAVHISGKQLENAVILSVADNGVGISKRDLDRVFEKGFTGENGRMNGKSTGFGLYLAHQLCEQLGLRLTIDSQKGQGTTARIIIPQHNPYR